MRESLRLPITTIGEDEISLLSLTNGTTEIKESELILPCVQPDVDVD